MLPRPLAMVAEIEACRLAKHYVGFGEEDERVLISLRPFFKEIADEVVHEFYAQVTKVPELDALIRAHSTVGRLKQTQKAYFLRLVEGGYGKDYARERYRIGEKHERIGLDSRWYLGAYQIYFNLLVPRLIARYGRDPMQLERALLAVMKILNFDAQMAIETYITSRERTLSETAKALRAVNHELEEMNYIVTHDLKAPLVTIQGFAERLEARCKDQVDSTCRRYLTILGEVSKLAGQMVVGLLELHRIPRRTFRLRPLDLPAVVGGLLHGLRAELDSTGTTVEMDLDRTIPPIQSDAVLLHEVLESLISNAVKFAAPDRPTRVLISAEVKHEHVIVSVRDNGIGIPVDQQAQVFRVFKKLDKRTPGVGIGLTLVKRLMQSAGGRVWLESEEGIGTTVFLMLPRRSTHDTKGTA